MIDLQEFLNRFRLQRGFEVPGKAVFQLTLQDDVRDPETIITVNSLSEDSFGNTRLHYQYTGDVSTSREYEWAPYKGSNAIVALCGRTLRTPNLFCITVGEG